MSYNRYIDIKGSKSHPESLNFILYKTLYDYFWIIIGKKLKKCEHNIMHQMISRRGARDFIHRHYVTVNIITVGNF